MITVPVTFRLLITLVVALVIVILSVTPGTSRPGDGLFVWLVVTTPTTIQKLMHLAAYGCLAFLWYWTLSFLESRPSRWLLALVLTVSIGAALEWYQTMVPGRFGTVMDAILNSIGAVVGLLAAVLLL
jgi:hypothetical protein